MKHLTEPIRKQKDLKLIEEFLFTNKRNHLIFLLGINVGLRVSDILNLNISDVKDKKHIEIREKKTGKYKCFLLNEKLRNLVGSYLKEERVKTYSLSEDEPLFVGKKHQRLCRSQVYRFLREACSALNISVNIGTHSMRKTFGYHFYKKFNDVVLLQKILNHSTPAITLRYIGIAQEEIDTSYNNFTL